MKYKKRAELMCVCFFKRIFIFLMENGVHFELNFFFEIKINLEYE